MVDLFSGRGSSTHDAFARQERGEGVLRKRRAGEDALSVPGARVRAGRVDDDADRVGGELVREL